jgi:hypothetical protein
MGPGEEVGTGRGFCIRSDGPHPVVFSLSLIGCNPGEAADKRLKVPLEERRKGGLYTVHQPPTMGQGHLVFFSQTDKHYLMAQAVKNVIFLCFYIYFHTEVGIIL